MCAPTALVRHARTGQEMVSDALEVDFRPIGVAKWMLGTNPGPLPERPGLFTSEPSVQAQKP